MVDFHEFIKKYPTGRFYSDYARTFIERDVKQLINIKDQDQFQRFFCVMCSKSW